MRWEDERWVKLYTRDTPDWATVSLAARGLFYELTRKVDGAGILHVGRKGAAAIAACVRSTTGEVAPLLNELQEDGCVVLEGERLIIPNFVEAQEAKSSDTARKRTQRERDRDQALAGGMPEKHSSKSIEFTKAAESRAVTRGHAESHGVTHVVTPGHAVSREVTPGHAVSREVTPGHAVSREVTPGHDQKSPDQKSPEEPRGEAPRTEPVSALGGAVAEVAAPDRRVTPTGEPGDLQNKMGRAWFDKHGVAFDWPMDEQRAVGAAIGKAGGDEAEVCRRWANALEYAAFPVCGGVKDLVRYWNRYGTGPPKAASKDPHKAPIRAEEISKDKFENPGRVNDF